MQNIYNKFILKYSKTILFLLLVGIGCLAYQATKLEIDASAETLLLEDDKDLALTRKLAERYKSAEFLIIAYTPQDDLLAPTTRAEIKNLSNDLLKLEQVNSVTSILNVPLLASPVKPVKELMENVPSLESPDIDIELARQEFISSPLYKNNLVSEDLKTTAILVNLKEDTRYLDLKTQKKFLQRKLDETDDPVIRQKLSDLNIQIKQHRDYMREVNHQNILDVRKILNNYRDNAEIFLGGVRMIADDLVTFIKDDLNIFGIGVLLLLIIALSIIFRQIRWIILPIITCSLSVIATAGVLGMFGWEVTVISSNFISLQLILTMAITIHLIVRYRELVIVKPEASQKELLVETVDFISKPCLYTVLTTIAGFASLMFSGILPVINFGWMMSFGVVISLFMTFLIFPTVMMQMSKLAPKSVNSSFMLTHYLAIVTQNFKKSIPIISLILFAVSIGGSLMLKVENSFIDYFKPSTEIYQGLSIIDKKLGGTTPLDITITFNDADQVTDIAIQEDSDVDESEDAFDDFEEEFSAIENQDQYWFTDDKMTVVEQVHNYLESQPEIGNVSSLATMLKVGKQLNNDQPLDGFLLALIYNKLPEEFSKIILSPYLSIENNQVRFSARITDSLPDLRRNNLIKRIQADLENKLSIAPSNFNLSNMLVLYNNMLQSLFDSQIKTLSVVVLLLFIMFLILFRSIKVSMIALFPNVLSIAVVLGFMGWASIPLDMMTITIAAISMGIAVDNTIHYIYRFRYEFNKSKNYLTSMHAAHNSIGHAMYYTSITVILGFSILVFSNFIPSIYFGLLTALAMLIALIGALTLLPRLLMLLRAFGHEV